jgi:hypothetical protein
LPKPKNVLIYFITEKIKDFAMSCESNTISLIKSATNGGELKLIPNQPQMRQNPCRSRKIHQESKWSVRHGGLSVSGVEEEGRNLATKLLPLQERASAPAASAEKGSVSLSEEHKCWQKTLSATAPTLNYFFLFSRISGQPSDAEAENFWIGILLKTLLARIFLDSLCLFWIIINWSKVTNCRSHNKSFKS